MEWQVSVLLKIARLESGTVELKRDPVSVREVVDQAWEPLAIPAELKNIAIEINVEENSCFQGDLAWTVEALGNVLKNCVEHLPDGGRIEIRAARNPIYTGICIADNGAGIPEEELPHLFERFYRGTSKRGVGENAGIGLAPGAEDHSTCKTARYRRGTGGKVARSLRFDFTGEKCDRSVTDKSRGCHQKNGILCKNSRPVW